MATNLTTTLTIEGTDYDLGDAESRTNISTLQTALETETAARIAGDKANHDSASPVIVGTASGDMASFSDGADGLPLKSLMIKLNPVQEGEGDPSPSNNRPMIGWTGANVTRTGKNLCPPFTATLSAYIPINFGIVSEYTLSSDLETPKAIIYAYDSEKNFIARTAGAEVNPRTFGKAAFSIEVRGNMDNARYITLRFYEATAEECAQASVQLEKGSTATAYEPYNGDTYSISWSDSAGIVYGGTLDVLSGKLRVDRASVNLADITWSLRSGGYFRGTVPNVLNGYGDGGFDDPCSCYPTFYPASGALAVIPDKVYISGWSNIGKYIAIKDTSYATVNDFVSSLTGQTAVYHIEPVEYTLTPTEIDTLLGINNIWADCGSIANCEYPADTKLYIDNKIAAIVATMSES